MASSYKARTLGVTAGLAALSAALQLAHVGYQSPQWGMWIDIVAVSWLIAYFMFGGRIALTVSLLGALVITLFAPETWLGATMKWTATIPVITSLWLYARVRRRGPSLYRSPYSLIVPLILGVVIRCALVIPINYQIAIPIWTGMTPADAMRLIPWYIIALFNIVQSVIDVALGWALVYGAKLHRFVSERSVT